MSKLVVTNLADLHEWDAKRIEFALLGANRILASAEFKAKLLAATLTETNGLTNQGVYDCIMAADQLNPTDKKGELDVQVLLYRKSWSKVVGYTFVDSLSIWVNRKFFGGPCNIASNLVHESSHQLGFLHQGRWSTTVPYTLNRIVEEIWPKLCADVEKEYWAWWYS